MVCSLPPIVQHPVTYSKLINYLLSVYEKKNCGGV